MSSDCDDKNTSLADEPRERLSSKDDFRICQKVQREWIESTKPKSNLFNLDNLPNLQRIVTMKKALTGKRSQDKVYFNYGGISHEFNCTMSQNQPGNFYVVGMGKYNYEESANGTRGITKELRDRFEGKDWGESLEAKNERVKQMFGELKQSRLSGKPIEESFCNRCPMCRNSPGSRAHHVEDAKFLNRLSILLDFEVVRRLFGDVFGDFYPLPVAIGIACMLDNIANSSDLVSCFDKYFNKNQDHEKFHMFSGTKENRIQAILNIVAEKFPAQVTEKLLKDLLEEKTEDRRQKTAMAEVIAKLEKINIEEKTKKFINGWIVYPPSQESQANEAEYKTTLEAQKSFVEVSQVAHMEIRQEIVDGIVHHHFSNNMTGRERIAAVRKILQNDLSQVSKFFVHADGMEHRFQRQKKSKIKKKPPFCGNFSYYFGDRSFINIPRSDFLKNLTHKEMNERLVDIARCLEGQESTGFQKIAIMLRRSSSQGLPITSEILRELNYSGDHIDADTEFLNGCCLGLIQYEVCRDLSRNLPVGVVISCMLENIISSTSPSTEKYLSNRDFYIFGGPEDEKKSTILKILGERFEGMKQRDEKLQAFLTTHHDWVVTASQELLQKLLSRTYGRVRGVDDDH